MSDGANTPGKPSIITFGRGGGRQKRIGYTTTRSLDNDQNSLNQLGGWPEEQHGKTTATVGVGEQNVELHQFGIIQPQSITVKTEVAWHASDTYSRV